MAGLRRNKTRADLAGIKMALLLPEPRRREIGRILKASRRLYEPQTGRFHMATKQRISAELGRMAIAYRHPIDGQNEFPLLVEDWADLCAGIADEDFTAACKLHKARSTFFPVPANIITAHEELKPHAPMTALPGAARKQDTWAWTSGV